MSTHKSVPREVSDTQDHSTEKVRIIVKQRRELKVSVWGGSNINKLKERSKRKKGGIVLTRFTGILSDM